MLQVVESAAICDRRDHGAELQGRHGYTLAEGAHLAYTTQFSRNFRIRIRPEMLAPQVVAGEFSQPELVRVVADFFKSKLPAKRLKICVVRVRQGIGQVHAVTSAEADL